VIPGFWLGISASNLAKRKKKSRLKNHWKLKKSRLALGLRNPRLKGFFL